MSSHAPDFLAARIAAIDRYGFVFLYVENGRHETRGRITFGARRMLVTPRAFLLVGHGNTSEMFLSTKVNILYAIQSRLFRFL